MIEVLEDKDTYLSSFAQFERSSTKSEPLWLQKMRSAAMDCFAELGFPTLRDEEWRFTNLAPLTRTPFQPAAAPTSQTITDCRRSFSLEDVRCRIVFINGHYSPELSKLDCPLAGVTVAPLSSVLKVHPEWLEPQLAHYADYEEHAFTALNTAFVHDGAFISIGRGIVVLEPIHLLYLSSVATNPSGASTPAVSNPRTLILAGVYSQATVIETYAGAGGVYFTNAVTEIVADEGAVIDHYKLQQESLESFHVTTMQVHQGRSSNFSSHSIALGGALVRNDVNAVLAAEGCECTLNGLYMTGGRQHIDNHTRIDHTKPHCASHELYKGILDGNSRGVFNGKIYVHQDAQKTDAKQTNKTLLLSEDAVINTKPQLEIYADDVKCTHGATIGQLAEEAIFYLRSRGIGHEEARSLLTYAFANDVISRIKVEPIRARLEQVLLASRKLPDLQNIGDPE